VGAMVAWIVSVGAALTVAIGFATFRPWRLCSRSPHWGHDERIRRPRRSGRAIEATE
jgi:hypothetical protein